jgi:hypothetical protein
MASMCGGSEEVEVGSCDEGVCLLVKKKTPGDGSPLSVTVPGSAGVGPRDPLDGRQRARDSST